MKQYHYTVQLGPYKLDVEFQANSMPDALAKLQDALLFAKITDAHAGDKDRNKGDADLSKKNIGGYTDFPELKGRPVFAKRPAKKVEQETALISDDDLALCAAAPKGPSPKDLHREHALSVVAQLQEERHVAA